MNAEEWRRIDFAPDYEVSNRGRVRSWRRSTGRILKGHAKPTGHTKVRLQTLSGPRSVQVHRLVAHAFIGPCPDGLEVCHNDGDATNNDVRNLRYGTRADNMQDRLRHGTNPWAQKTHCPHGHAYDADNTRLDRNGYRHCWTCNRATTRRWNQSRPSRARVA